MTSPQQVYNKLAWAKVRCVCCRTISQIPLPRLLRTCWPCC